MYELAAEKFVGKKRMTLGIPAWYAMGLTKILPARLLPFNRDQVIMSGMDNVGDQEEFGKDFGWKPRGFGETLEY
jgi:hypothetical protein